MIQDSDRLWEGVHWGYKYSPWVKRRSVFRQGMLSVHLFAEWDYIKSYSAPVLRKPSTKRPANSPPRRKGIDKLYEDSSKDTGNFKQACFRTLMLIGYKISQNCIVSGETDYNTLKIKPRKERLCCDASELLKMLFVNKGFFNCVINNKDDMQNVNCEDN